MSILLEINGCPKMDRCFFSGKKICCTYNLPVITLFLAQAQGCGSNDVHKYSHLYAFRYYIQDPVFGIVRQHPLFPSTLQRNSLPHHFYRKMEYSNLQRQAAYMKKSLFDQVTLFLFPTSINLDLMNYTTNRNHFFILKSSFLYHYL